MRHFGEMSQTTTQEIIACQYRKLLTQKEIDEGKKVKVWDSCGAFTYNFFKDDPLYEVRRLVVYNEA